MTEVAARVSSGAGAVPDGARASLSPVSRAAWRCSDRPALEPKEDGVIELFQAHGHSRDFGRQRRGGFRDSRDDIPKKCGPAARSDRLVGAGGGRCECFSSGPCAGESADRAEVAGLMNPVAVLMTPARTAVLISTDSPRQRRGATLK